MREHGVGSVAACALATLRPSNARHSKHRERGQREGRATDDATDHAWRNRRRMSFDEEQENEPRECSMWYE